MKRAIVTVLGEDKVGIIAAVSSRLAQYSVNILDITQTIMKGDVFVMIALVDIGGTTAPFHEIKADLSALGASMDLSIRIQLEEIFNAMHKV
ncbi:MAG: ACT domain-containing protein [Christensenellales bacterium]